MSDIVDVARQVFHIPEGPGLLPQELRVTTAARLIDEVERLRAEVVEAAAEIRRLREAYLCGLDLARRLNERIAELDPRPEPVKVEAPPRVYHSHRFGYHK